MTSMSGSRRMVIYTAVLALASAVIGVTVLASAPRSFAMATATSGFSSDSSTPSPTMSGDMPGMDHGSGAHPESTPSPTMPGDMPGMDHGSSDMPGMDHGSGDMPQSTPTPTMSGDMPGMDHGSGGTEEATVDRPLAPVLGVFGGGASAVMLTAGFLRRRDRARLLAKQAIRAARRHGK